MIRIALLALLATAAISQPIGEPIVQEKVTHSKPVITTQYGPAEVITEDEAHRLIKEYMIAANQKDQFDKLNWQVSGSNTALTAGDAVTAVSDGASNIAAAGAANAAADFSGAVNAAEISGASHSVDLSAANAANSFSNAAAAVQFAAANAGSGSGSKFFLAKQGGYEFLGNDGLAKLNTLAAPKTYTTTSTKLVSSAPSFSGAATNGGFSWSTPSAKSFMVIGSSAPVQAQSFKFSAPAPAAPAQTTSFQYVNAAPAAVSTVNTVAAPQVSSFEYNSGATYNAAPAVTINAAPAVDVAAPAAIQTSSFNYQSAPQYSSIYSANDTPSEIVQEKDLGLGASEHIEQVKY